MDGAGAGGDHVGMVLHPRGVEDVEERNGEPLPITATESPYIAAAAPRGPFPPIADYAFLSDCENTCLISATGSVEWMCVPRPDSPSVFGAVLSFSSRLA